MNEILKHVKKFNEYEQFMIAFQAIYDHKGFYNKKADEFSDKEIFNAATYLFKEKNITCPIAAYKIIDGAYVIHNNQEQFKHEQVNNFYHQKYLQGE